MRVEIYGGRRAQTRPFARALRAQADALGLSLELGRGAAWPVARGGRGRIAVAFAGPGVRWSHAARARFAALLQAGVTVLPVIARPQDAPHLPRELAKINAFLKRTHGDDWPTALVDEVLALAWLRRRTPKVFISYRRIDSGAIAVQLFERFNRLGYETFLDDAEIGHGRDFQRDLMFWLNDADLVLVLASPRFEQSRWCMDEINFAREHDIGVQLVAWPGTDGARPAVLDSVDADQRMHLRRADLITPAGQRRGPRDPAHDQLSASALDRVVASCIQQRTLAIRQRLDELIPLAKALLPAHGPIRMRELGDLAFTDARGRRCFARVLPFRPRPETLYDTHVDGHRHEIIGCFYDECDADDARAYALRWLANGSRRSQLGTRVNKLWVCFGAELL